MMGVCESDAESSLIIKFAIIVAGDVRSSKGEKN